MILVHRWAHLGYDMDGPPPPLFCVRNRSPSSLLSTKACWCMFYGRHNSQNMLF